MPRRNSTKQIARHTRNQLFGVGDITSALTEQWDRVVAEFQAKREELSQAEFDLYNVEAYARNDPKDLAEWNSLYTKILYAQRAMDAIASGAAGVSNTWQTIKSWFGMSGIGGIGVLPAIPIATLAALTAAATIAISSTYTFIAYINSKTDRYSQLVGDGVDPVIAAREAAREAAETTGYSLPAQISKTAMWLALAAGAIVILPRVMKK
jgi:hypothetical protein